MQKYSEVVREGIDAFLLRQRTHILLTNSMNNTNGSTGTPFFSVIIPAYNAAKFIESTLSTVLKQTFKDYEIVVVDDGSADDTYEVARKYLAGFSEIKSQVVQQENKGVGGARNTAIQHASGEFLAFLDADDIWDERKFERVHATLSKDETIDLLCHDLISIEEDGTHLGNLRAGSYTTFDEFLFKGNLVFTTSTVARRKKVLEVGMFSEDMNFNSAEDYELWIRLSRNCKISYLHELLATHIYHGDNITSSIDIHMQKSLNVVDYHYSQIENKTLFQKIAIRRRRADLFRGGGRKFLQRGPIEESEQYFQKALQLNPFSLKNWYCWGIGKLMILLNRSN